MHKPNQWQEIDLSTLASGTNDKGVRYLQLFAKDYKQLFDEGLNIGCAKCIRQAHEKYKNKIMSTEPNTKARLKKKYQNISLGFGSSEVVNNDNITEKTARILLKNHGASIFEVLPEEKKKPTKKESSKKSSKSKK